MTLPTIHDNGTSARMLAASAEATFDALMAAYDLLKQTAPNARDYQPGAFGVAVRQHTERMQKLSEVLADLETLILDLDRAK